MTDLKPSTPEEKLAAKRYAILQLVRVGSILLVLLGIAIARDAVTAPYWLGVLLAVSGLVAFFFAPPLLARGWKSPTEDHNE